MQLAAGEGERQGLAHAARAVTPARQMMTPDHQVRAALKRLKPPPDQRNACRADIENALYIMAKVSISHTILAAQRSKAHSKAKRAYRRALCRLLAASKALLATGGGVPIDLGIKRIKRAIHATEPRRFEVLYRAGATKPTFAVALAYELLEK